MICRIAAPILLLLPLAQAQNSLPSPSTEEIVSRMEVMNQQRDLTQPKYACERTYTLDYRGFPDSKHAEMNVRSVQNDSREEFTITSESGSTALRVRVLHKMLDTEREAKVGALYEESRLTHKNYDFSMLGTQTGQEGILYVLAVNPRVKSKLAWSGRVWVDSKDYAVVRAEGQPDKMPSWWTTHSDFVSTYQKIGNIWLPKQNVSETQVRFGGHAHLVIDYKRCSSPNDEHVPAILP